MNDLDRFDKMLLALSNKEVIAKCEPFRFRLSYYGTFDMNSEKYKNVNNIIENLCYLHASDNRKHNSFQYLNVHLEYFHKKDFQDEIKKLSLHNIISVDLLNVPSFNDVGSSMETKFSIQNGVLFWNASYTILTSSHVAISIISENNSLFAVYIYGDKIKKQYIDNNFCFLGFNAL